MAVNVLDHINNALNDGRAQIELDPFPHVVVENLLPRETYDELEANFPPIEYIAELPEGAELENNRIYLRTAKSSLSDPDLLPMWRDFIETNTAHSTFASFLEIWGHEIARRHPGLEANFSKPIEAFTSARRNAKGDCEENRRSDVMLDCQFGMNSPVRKVSASRGPHVDRGAKLFSALLYFRDEKDESQGGEYELYRLKNGPFPQKKMKNVPARYIDCVKRVPYRANSLVMWLNTPEAIHAVAPRTETVLPRRYLAISGECFGGARPSDFFSHFDVWDRPLSRLRAAIGL